MRRTVTTAAAATVALLGCLAATGCGPGGGADEPSGTTGSGDGTTTEERVAELPGVADVEVSEGEIDQDGPEATTFFVTLDDDSSAEEVAAVLTELTEPGVDGNVRTMTHVGEASGYGGGVLAGDVAVRDVTDPADVEEAAELFIASLAVVEELGGEAGADVDYDSELTPEGSGAVVGINPASPSEADVDAAVAAVTDDQVLSDAGALVVGQEAP